MRFYILDDLVSPGRAEPLCVEASSIVEREGPQVERCVRWCGRRGAPSITVTEEECRQCSKLWIESGVLTDGVEIFTIRDGIPRFVRGTDPKIDGKTQESFGYEWEHFDGALPEYDVEVGNYFGIVPAAVLAGAIVLDAGCGMGRWARQIANRSVRRLYAVDFSSAIDVAAHMLADKPTAHCIQADVCNLPFRSEGIDFTYCLGVLHHLEDPEAGMRSVCRVTHGPLLIYLYYSLDNRPHFHRVLLAIVTVLRRLTTRLPKSAMLGLSWIIAMFVYWPLARMARMLDRKGFGSVAHDFPLSHYRDYSFKFMVADAFDRFATPIENRYSRAEIAAWLARYGREASFSDRTPYWVSLGTPTR